MRLQENGKSENKVEPYGVELLPMNDNSNLSGNDLEKFKYTGQERDNFTNYDDMHFRYYASSMGRFMKPDNVIMSISKPQGFNLYLYVGNNPINNRDPNGHEIVTTVIVTTVAAGLIVGGIITYIYLKEDSQARERAQAKNAINKADQLEQGKQISEKWNEETANIAINERQEALEAVKPAVGEAVPAAPGSQVGELMIDLMQVREKVMDFGARLLGIGEDKQTKKENEEKKGEERDKEEKKQEVEKAKLPPGTPGAALDERSPKEEVKH